MHAVSCPVLVWVPIALRTEETRWLVAHPKNLVVVKHVGKTGRARGARREHGHTRK